MTYPHSKRQKLRDLVNSGIPLATWNPQPRGPKEDAASGTDSVVFLNGKRYRGEDVAEIVANMCTVLRALDSADEKLQRQREVVQEAIGLIPVEFASPEGLVAVMRTFRARLDAAEAERDVAKTFAHEVSTRCDERVRRVREGTDRKLQDDIRDQARVIENQARTIASLREVLERDGHLT